MEEKTEKTRSAYKETILKINSFLDTIGASGNAVEYAKAWIDPSIQNDRIKNIGTLPIHYSKEDINLFLENAPNYERSLAQVSQSTRWTNYPYFKVAKSYADMLTYRHYSFPQFSSDEDFSSKGFEREYRLVDSLEKKFFNSLSPQGIAQQAMEEGKVFYVPRYDVDKSHNKINYAFLQRLPQNRTRIIGYNNVSRYTLSFDLMYFTQLGTDPKQFGDLFDPYLDDFYDFINSGNVKKNPKKYAYASGFKPSAEALQKIKSKNNKSVEVWSQDGRWMYYVALPIDRVFTFEIDSSTPVVVSPLASLMLTFLQQHQYEACQLSLVTNPLIKIFTGEIPYRDENLTADDDEIRLSPGGRKLYEAYWNELMRLTNTGGTAMYSAPFQNIRSHDFPAAANANETSSSFLQYGMEKTGLTALIPVTDKPAQGTGVFSGKLEAQFPKAIYDCFTRMMESIYATLNLAFEWNFKMFGDIYNDGQTRQDAEKELAIGDMHQRFILAAMDGVSLLDKITMSKMAKALHYEDYLIPPQTAYTQGGGRPTGTQEQQIESQTRDGAPTQK